MHTPPTPAARLEALDLVRGFAVLGILPVNAAFFAYPIAAALNPSLPPQPITPDTAWAWALMHIGFELKMITLFSMLFGVSLFLVGGDRNDPARAQQLRARLFWLAVIGALHGALIWYGDILLTYALCGALTMGLRGRSASALLGLAVGLLALALALQGALGFVVATMPAAERATLEAQLWRPPAAELARTVAAMQTGLVPALMENLREWFGYLGYVVFFAPRTLGLMLLGLGLYKTGFFHGRWAGRAYELLAALGVASLAGVAWRTGQGLSAGGYSFDDALGLGSLWNFGLSVPIALGYAAGLIWLVKVGALSGLTQALARCGRMAFTNYLTQSLIMTSLFWGGRGLGWFGELDRVSLWGVVVAIWAVQLVASWAWLRVFAIGPLEWVWRSLTLGQFVALRNRA